MMHHPPATAVQRSTMTTKSMNVGRISSTTGSSSTSRREEVRTKTHVVGVRSCVLDLCSMRQQTALADLVNSSSVASISGSTPSTSHQNDVVLLQSDVLREGLAPASSSLPQSSSSQLPDTFGTVLEGRLLDSVDLSLSKVSASFNRATLNSSLLDGATFLRCTFHLTMMKNTTAVDARWFHCSFLGSDLQHFDGRATRFMNCTFHRCDLTSWRVEGAAFSGCTFHKCKMDGWVFDGQTTFVNYKAPTASSQVGWVQSEKSLARFGPQDVTILRAQAGSLSFS